MLTVVIVGTLVYAAVRYWEALIAAVGALQDRQIRVSQLRRRQLDEYVQEREVEW